MLETSQLRSVIGREVFDYQQLTGCLSSLRKPRDRIGRLLSKGEIVRVRKGLYVFGDLHRRRPVSRELLANLIYGPSHISLDYALARHGLIPERIDEVTSVTTGRSRSIDTPFGTFSYRHLPPARYAPGVDLERIEDESFLIATPEKALVDKVWMDKRFAGTRLSDYGPYLLEDLRIGRERLAELDGERLETVARAYGSQKIDGLMRYLQRLRERRGDE